MRDNIHELYILVSDEHTDLITTSYHVPKLRYRIHSLDCGKWRKISKSCCDLDLHLTMQQSHMWDISPE